MLPIAGVRKPDARFDDRLALDELRPSFRMKKCGFGAFTEYCVGVAVYMPGIDVRTACPSKWKEPYVLYAPPPTPRYAVSRYAWTSKDSFSIRNKYLLPKNERPEGSKESITALFKPATVYPGCNCDVVLSAPEHIYIESPMEFTIMLRPDDSKCEASCTSDVNLVRFQASLKASTVIRTEKNFSHGHEKKITETIAILDGDVEMDGLFPGVDGYTTTVRTPALLADVSPTFITVNIARTYVLEVGFRLLGAGKRKTIVRGFDVLVHPAIEGRS